MIKTYLYTNEASQQCVKKSVSIEGIKEYLSRESSTDSLLWVDLFDMTPEEIQKIGAIFHFHPLAIEDCLHHTLRSKVDQYDDYTFFVFNDVEYNENHEEEVTTHELNVFLGHQYIVTVHRKPIHAIGKIVKSVQYSHEIMAKGPDYLLYYILDGIVDDYFPILERLEERIDELEDEMYVNLAQEISEEFLALKRTIVQLRRVIQPKKRIFANVGSRYLFTVQEQNIPYFMDLVDHLERISDSLEVHRDLVSGAMDTYYSIVSARTNKSMTRLTVITTITALLTAITGFFGMNTPLPFQNHPITTVVILVVVILIPIIGWQIAKKWGDTV